MRIGILTFQYAYNYGALLQAYALCKYLERLNHDVDFINFIPPGLYPANRLKQYKIWGRDLIKQKFDMPRYMLKRLQFEQFRQHFLPLTSPCTTKSELEAVSKNFDAVIVGSDQVWNGNFIKNVASHYFFDFIGNNCCRRISYAASFGDALDTQPKETIEAVKKHLPLFDSISVRDEVSTQIIETILDKEVNIVLDPTLLHDFQDIAGYAKNNSENYIACYHISPVHIETGCKILDHVSQHLKLPVHLIGTRVKNYNSFISTGPLQWLQFFQQASFICADSFHATVFSVKFRKPFITWCGNRPERARYFLKLCGLENRQIEKADPSAIKELVNTPIDYDKVYENLKPYLNNSFKFITNALL